MSLFVAALSDKYSGAGLCSLPLLSNVFYIMSMPLYGMLCLSSHALMSSFLSLDVGDLLWYEASSSLTIDGSSSLGSSCSITIP